MYRNVERRVAGEVRGAGMLLGVPAPGMLFTPTHCSIFGTESGCPAHCGVPPLIWPARLNS